jgi:hypothetical protein
MTPSNGDSSENIINAFNYYNTTNEQNSVTNSLISYQYKINNKFLFSSELTFKKDKISNNLFIKSSDNNLFNLNFNSLYQSYLYNNSHFNNINSLLFKNNKNKYKYSFSFYTNSEYLKTEIPYNSFNNINRSLKNISNKFDFTQYINEEIFLKYQFILNSYHINSNSKNLIDNNFSINYNFNAGNNFSLGYQNTNSVVELVKQFNNNYVINYQSLNIPFNIENNPFINKKSIIFAYNSYRSNIEQFFTANLTYTFAERYNTTNTTYINNYSLFSHQFAGKHKNLLGIFIYDRKFTSFPITFKSSLSLNYTYSISFINSILNNSNLTKGLLNINFLSRFKNKKIQFQLSYLTEYFNLKQSLVSKNQTLMSQNIGFRIISKINLLKIEPSINYLMQNGSANSNYKTLISINFNYTDKNNKFNYFIKSNNLFNINDFEQITQTSDNSVIENTIHSMIPGYVLFGIKYNY